ncbi:MAG: hypothetical protein ACI97A_000928 [Planctomycetota bacterium]|jgi:hypothetical protein
MSESRADDESNRTYRFDAFISYRHVETDRQYAKWLHRALETYRIPKTLVAQGYPSRVGRVFRDEEELPASPNLSHSIEEALETSRFLVVVCSPRIKESIWCDAEVQKFRDLGRHDKIIALLIEGEPVDSFLPSLCEIRSELVQQDGTRIEHIEAVEPLAADVRPSRHESQRELKNLAKLRILACILGCRFDDLRQREQGRKQKRMAALGLTLGFLVLVFLGLATWALSERNLAETAQTKAESAEQDAKQALKKNEIENSRGLFENGTRLMNKGLIEEGLASLVRSLRIWPENTSARERLLYELHYRRWLVPTGMGEIKPLPRTEGEESRRYRILDDGTLSVSYIQEATSKESTRMRYWNGQWQPDTSPEPEEDFGEAETQVGPLKITREEIEGPASHAKVVLKTKNEEITTFGLFAVHPDKKIVAVVGQLTGGSDGIGYDDGLVNACWYDTTTLELVGELTFSRPEGTDVVRLIWSVDRLHVVSQADNREFPHLDIIDTAEGDLLIHNNILPTAEWVDSITYEFNSEYGRPEGGTLWSFANGQVVSYTLPPMNSSTDSITRQTFGISDATERFAKVEPDLHLQANEPGVGEDIQTHCELTGETAKLGRNGIYISNKSGEIIQRIRPKVLSGEGGRQLMDLAYSPQGRYILVKGLSAGGGVDDWEVHNNQGSQVFPVCLPRGFGYYRNIPHMISSRGCFTPARGWSKDGKYIIFQGVVSGYRGVVTRKPDMSFQVVFCTTPPPTWVLTLIDRVLKVRIQSNGQFSCAHLSTLEPIENRNLAVDTASIPEYAQFIKRLIPTN